jgi:hypothetical protein
VERKKEEGKEEMNITLIHTKLKRDKGRIVNIINQKGNDSSRGGEGREGRRGGGKEGTGREH